MDWVALSPPEPERSAWGWWALRFTPRVAWLDEALLLEVSASERLWGGRRRLLRELPEAHPFEARPEHAQGATSRLALARLRLLRRGEVAPPQPDLLPLDTLSAALPHLDTLARAGCRRWGQLRALPRGGVARRFGAALLEALDAAYGERPETHAWLTLPEHFDAGLELPALAASAPELMWAAQRLLAQLQAWLQARQRGVLALELEWTLDLRRLDGADLPPHERLALRTARPTQDLAHLRRLLGEHLARATLSAPANQLRLRSLETAPWAGASASLLPEDRFQGEPLHQLVERLSARLGAHQVVLPLARSDHRPERMQCWVPAQQPGPKPGGTPVPLAADALYPPWLLPRPLPLALRDGVPQHGGHPLLRLARPHRVETAWWEEGGPALRDYFLARSEAAGLVWIYRERPLAQAREVPQVRWYLQGLYG